MHKVLMISALVTGLGATVAVAQPTTEEIVSMYPGATRIEIDRGFRYTEVEVYIDGKEVDLRIDNTSGEVVRERERVLSQKEWRDEAYDDDRTNNVGGVEVETDDDDRYDDDRDDDRYDDRDDDDDDDHDDDDDRDDNDDDDDHDDDDDDDDD
ncbi:PepSY domain-containing protein [Celeribacter persicus]|uniref:PepSY domain-containing protein n=1 Tax=Celeribacter persicus TaxID=1651082 RepID=A0A2T5HS65_9RHOB|nr:PepSY domain-containing protein [Celeribacter persicus]PTQ74419.1 hypothetical protein C8N42_10463 [Celeribacter persicus]